MWADQHILTLSKLSLNMKDLLPEYSGIYYVLDENQTVWYIGQAKNIRKRWQGKAHHRIYQLESQKKYHFYIYYEAVNASDLNTVEKQRIQQYDPHLNESPVKTKKVFPAETLLRETISAISNFAFIVGIEDKHKIYICVDEECMKKIYNVQS
jgi:excinuclease UvrABC nuclease subunit